MSRVEDSARTTTMPASRSDQQSVSEASSPSIITLPEHAVAARAQAGVEDGQDAAVALGAEQTPHALLQADDRRRHLVVAERVAALLAHAVHPRLHHRVRRHLERQPIDDHQAEGVARDVHPLPER